MSENEFNRGVPIGWGLGAFGASYGVMYIFASMGGGGSLASISEQTKFFLLTGLLSVSGESGDAISPGEYEHLISQTPGFVVLTSGLIFLTVAVTMFLMEKVSNPNYNGNLIECAGLVTAPYIVIATWLASDFQFTVTEGSFDLSAKADPVLTLFAGGFLVFSSVVLVLWLLE